MENPTWFEKRNSGKNLNEFNLKYGFENYIVTKIFDAPSNDKKVWKKKKVYTIQYAILILLLHYS